MNIRSNRSAASLLGAIALASTLAVPPCRAVEDHPTLGLRTTSSANAKLGSSDAAARFVTTDYAKAFDVALPPVDTATLEKMVAGLLEKYSRGSDPLKIRRPRDIAKLLGLPEGEPKQGEDFVVDDAGSYSYGVDPETSRVVFAKGRGGMASLTFALAEGLRKDVREEHLRLLSSVGIDAPQILFEQTLLLSMRAEKKSTKPPDEGELGVDGIFTYVLRSLDGIQVGGSHAKIVSKGLKNVVSLDLIWPAVKLHDQIKDAKCKDTAVLRSEIVPRIRKTAGGQEIGLLMAVVLRPVSIKGQQAFVPSMKVGVMPTGDGSDAAAIFHVDLPRQKLSYDATDLDDDDMEP